MSAWAAVRAADCGGTLAGERRAVRRLNQRSSRAAVARTTSSADRGGGGAGRWVGGRQRPRGEGRAAGRRSGRRQRSAQRSGTRRGEWRRFVGQASSSSSRAAARLPTRSVPNYLGAGAGGGERNSSGRPVGGRRAEQSNGLAGSGRLALLLSALTRRDKQQQGWESDLVVGKKRRGAEQAAHPFHPFQPRSPPVKNSRTGNKGQSTSKTILVNIVAASILFPSISY